MEQLQRIGLSLENGLLAQFDTLIEARGYASRSEAVRDLIRETLTDEKLASPDSLAVAAVMMVFDHHQSSLSQKLIELQHDSHLDIISSMHVHIDHHNCLEVILLRGKVTEITTFGNKIVSLKGVKLGKVNLIATDENHEHHH